MKMWLDMKIIFLEILCCFSLIHISYQSQNEYHFVVKEANYTRLCSTKSILTVNGKYPGPIIRAHYGETVYVNVYNKGKYNITLHWHGVKQPRNPWSDGPEYITQRPIKPGGKLRQKVKFSIEEGTLWWHAHSDWWRATVHGPIFVYPRKYSSYPFPKHDAEVPIILGEWWKSDIIDVFEEFVRSEGDPNAYDNPCSQPNSRRHLQQGIIVQGGGSNPQIFKYSMIIVIIIFIFILLILIFIFIIVAYVLRKFKLRGRRITPPPTGERMP